MQKFAVSDVAVEKKPFDLVERKTYVERLAGGPVEACSDYTGKVLAVGHGNQLQKAVNVAFAKHYPLVISPDDVWLTVAQGLAAHVTANSEKLRKRFVAHDGKKKIEIRRDDFRKGSPENDWGGVIGEFSEKLKEHVGPETHAMIVSDFSTTGPVERAASEVVLMDAMQNYFNYAMGTLCGIPSVRLEGTVEDWEKVAAKGAAICDKAEGLGFWEPHLRQVLDEFVKAAKGKPNASWWRSIYKVDDQSGGPYITGWISWLFPYLGVRKDYKAKEKTLQPNRLLGQLPKDRDGGFGGLHDGDFPSSLAKAPFVWNYLGTCYDYELVAGLTGVIQDAKTHEVRPAVGWAVRQQHDGKSTRAEPGPRGEVVFYDDQP